MIDKPHLVQPGMMSNQSEIWTGFPTGRSLLRSCGNDSTDGSKSCEETGVAERRGGVRRERSNIGSERGEVMMMMIKWKGEKSGDGKGGNVGKSEGEIEKEVTEASKKIEFGKVKIGNGEERRRKKKLSKAKKLEMAKRLEEEVKKDPTMAKKHSWKAAVSRAAGDKVHDDPKLLKQSMNKENRRHEKNVGKWKERVESREKVNGEKQQKRARNIAERIHQKKMRKIAKREKKLMRPGFEGRKEGEG